MLDFNALDFMDSSGLAVLLAVTKHAREQSCDISLVRPQDGLLRLFRVAGVDTMLPVQPDRGDEPTGAGYDLGGGLRRDLSGPRGLCGGQDEYFDPSSRGRGGCRS